MDDKNDFTMIIYPIQYPGTWIESVSLERGTKISKYLYDIQNSFNDANLAMNLFVLEHLRSHQDVDKNISVYPEITKLPREHLDRLLHLYANAFLFALDSFGKKLKKLSSGGDIPKSVKDQLIIFQSKFPNLSNVLNTDAHMEDRKLGHPYTKPIQSPAINSKDIKPSEGAAFFTDTIYNDTIGYTTASGDFDQIEISPKTMTTIQNIFQNIINSFAWSGLDKFVPS